MKQLILLLFCFLPPVVSAQIKNFTTEEIQKDKNYIALTAEIKPFEDKLQALLKESQQATPAQKNDPAYRAGIEKRYSEVANELTIILKSFIAKHPDSYISLLALNELISSGTEATALYSLYQKLSESVQKTDLGNELGIRILSSTRTAIGAVAPDFTQKDPSGKPVKLSDFLGKYVLIDFWASWCGPCRSENPNVVKAYKQFKNKNFEILGVSLDNPNAKSAWLKAIETDKLTWPQVSDLQGWKNSAARLYGVQSIPQNFLLDPKGVIVAKNLRGEQLIATLNTVLNERDEK